VQKAKHHRADQTMTAPTTTPIVVWGEVLCDLFATHKGVALSESPVLVPHLGGAPANVAVQIARLGLGVQLVSAIGDDPLGERMKARLVAEGVDVRGVRRIPSRRTGITLVQVENDGERRFFPWRADAADDVIDESWLPYLQIPSMLLLHHGTVTLRNEICRQGTCAAVRCAHDSGACVSLDVNLRPGMFTNPVEMIARARAAVRNAHVVKATLEEASALVDSCPVDVAVEKLVAMGPTLCLVTLGKDGCVVGTKQGCVHVPVRAAVVEDATGAGDAFMGAALCFLVERYRKYADARAIEGPRSLAESLGSLSVDDLRALGAFANEAGACATEAMGATTSMMRARM
jgi:fructokinase